MADRWAIEIEALHRFFEGWFAGTVTSMDRMEESLDASFTMVGPDGGVATRSESIDAVRRGGGAGNGLEIDILEPTLVVETEQVVVARYVERHVTGGSQRDRWSTVVFRVDPSGPNGLRWLTVHETARP